MNLPNTLMLIYGKYAQKMIKGSVTFRVEIIPYQPQYKLEILGFAKIGLSHMFVINGENICSRKQHTSWMLGLNIENNQDFQYVYSDKNLNVVVFCPDIPQKGIYFTNFGI